MLTFVEQNFVGSKLKSGLETNDMIIEVNGKLIGGMTEDCLAIELEVAGPELVMLVSRYKKPRDANDHTKEIERIKKLDTSMTDKSLLGLLEWTQSSNDDSIAQGRETGLRNQKPDEIDGSPGDQSSNDSLNEDAVVVVDQESNSSLEISEKVCKGRDPPSPQNPVLGTRQGSAEQPSPNVSAETPRDGNLNNTDAPTEKVSDKVRDKNVESDDSQDENCWMGCVCEKVHRVWPVFWIQCDGCQSWFNVAAQCIGFDEHEAEKMTGWECKACCDEEDAIDQQNDPQYVGKDKEESTENSLVDPGNPGQVDPKLASNDTGPHVDASTTTPSKQASFEVVGSPFKEPEGSGRTDAKLDSDETDALVEASHHKFPDGTFVDVREHAWPGVNNPEGIAKVEDSRIDEDDGLVYDIRYVIGKSRRRGVLAEYLTEHDFD